MAIVNKKINELSSKRFSNLIAKIYHKSQKEVLNRIESLIISHKKIINGSIMLFSSPGRIEVIGNHTDHNNGKVVAASVSVDTLAAVTPTDDGIITILSEGYPPVKVDTRELSYNEKEEGSSESLVRGVLSGFNSRGYKIGGFTASTVSDVFKGAGMSSSASFEVLVCEILNNLYNDEKIPAIEKAIISQYAENAYFGKPSGLMDQASIALGGVSYIDFKDPQAPIVEGMHWGFSDVSVVVINCGGDHTELTPNYASIKDDMEKVAKFFGQTKLRFVDPEDFYNKIPLLKEKLSGRAILRAMHYFEENERVDRLRLALNKNEEQKVLDIINESGVSSYEYLQNLFPEGEEDQPIPLALALAKRQKGVMAARVHGGGFAGTILTFVNNVYKDKFCHYMKNIFGKDNVYAVSIRDEGTIRIL